MKRSAALSFECLFAIFALSVTLAACASSSGTPQISDGGVDQSSLDVKAKLDTGAGQIETAADHHDSSIETGDTSGDHTGAGDVHGETSTATTDASDVAHDTASDADVQPEVAADVPPDIAPEAAPDVAPEAGPADVGSDITTSPDASNDAQPSACGTGCPSTIHPDKLSYWFAADYGVSCDGSGRVSGWSNRGMLGGQAIPPSTKGGPLCTGLTTLGGRNVISFDDAGTDDNSGVLQIDLGAALVETDYTVFVVERRQSAAEGYFLGTNVDNTLLTTDCSIEGHLAYRFGYSSSPTYLYGGPYVPDMDGDCIIPQTAPAAFAPSNPVPSLDIDFFSQSVGHTTSSNGGAMSVDDDMETIHALPGGFPQGYLGRSFQPLDSGTRHSRFKGDIAEVVIYSTALTGDEQNAVSTYLATRWGIGP